VVSSPREAKKDSKGVKRREKGTGKEGEG